MDDPTETAPRYGSCEVLAEVAAGGMAVVYRGVQRPLGRTVALKRLKADHVASPEMGQRFRREALSVAALQHENIVGIYDYFEDAAGPAMILEWVDGIDLHDLLVKVGGPLPSDVAAIIALKIASALEFAHYRKVVHRDIKPSNVMISWKGEVKLTDFGIAKDMSFDDLTRTGLAVGTPAYMSPEQVVGAKLDTRSDQFSFGIVFYQLLTGKKPFEDGEDKTVLARIRDDDPVPVRRVNPDVPRTLARIVQRCLQKSADGRFAATAHLRQALEGYLSRHVHLNYSGRVVAFLHHRGMMTPGDAALYVEHDVLQDTEMQRVDHGGPPLPSLWPIAAMAAAALTALSLWISVLHAGVIGPGSSLATSAVAGRGHLKVVVDPWAHVWVDGVFVDTTPFAREIPLGAGRHRVLLKNDFLGEEAHVVDIPPDGQALLKVRLTD